MKNDEEILEYALNTLAFLLPFNGEYSFQEWAKNIENAYDLANLQINAVVQTIKKYNGKVIRRYGESKLVFNKD